ncbi:hypothetical protein HYU23_00495 [Candidatus Woesearchaeota archaeon]|nr:hypothetical protein [Candidatus Woesearchaeota archaeon]
MAFKLLEILFPKRRPIRIKLIPYVRSYCNWAKLNRLEKLKGYVELSEQELNVLAQYYKVKDNNLEKVKMLAEEDFKSLEQLFHEFSSINIDSDKIRATQGAISRDTHMMFDRIEGGKEREREYNSLEAKYNKLEKEKKEIINRIQTSNKKMLNLIEKILDEMPQSKIGKYYKKCIEERNAFLSKK